MKFPEKTYGKDKCLTYNEGEIYINYIIELKKLQQNMDELDTLTRTILTF